MGRLHVESSPGIGRYKGLKGVQRVSDFSACTWLFSCVERVVLVGFCLVGRGICSRVGAMRRRHLVSFTVGFFSFALIMLKASFNWRSHGTLCPRSPATPHPTRSMPQSSGPEVVTFEPLHQGRVATLLEDLPIELIMQIVGELEDDPPALKACASLRKSWRTICLPYLFKRIEMKRPTERKLLAFLIFLEGAPKVRCLIKSLLLNTQTGPDTLLALHSIDLFTRIVACLPNIERLAIRRIWFKQFEPPRAHGTDDRMDRTRPIPLALLIVNSCLAGPGGTLGELPLLFNVLSLFKVKKLCLMGLSVPPRAIPRDIGPRSRRRGTLFVENLEIRTPLSSEVGKVVAQELGRSLQAESIRWVNIMKANRASVLAAGALISTVGQNLEAFSLDVSTVQYDEFDMEPDLVECLGLARCIKLMLFTFYITIDFSARPCLGPRHCQLLAGILASRPPALRAIAVVLKVSLGNKSTSSPKPSPSQLVDVTDLLAVEKAVLDNDFKHLRVFSVRVDLKGRVTNGNLGWVEEVGRLLPRLKKSGLLTIE
ncbi:hypothetical protein C8Q70DRAFT_301238 [Cubamyces menziesii]|nr:hypothetical protein C8Q70DRAFT_301238 [Cubamyces menziesii]